MFVINPINVRVYNIADDADEHLFRNRLQHKDGSYVLYTTVKAQPRWYTSEEIAFKEELYRFRSLGYFILKNSALVAAGLSPAPDGGDWESYRLVPEINGTYSDEWLRIVEIRPESPLRGTFGHWYVHFDEVKGEDVIPPLEQTHSETQTDDLNEVVEVVREYT